jgi:hypothetical protein
MKCIKIITTENIGIPTNRLIKNEVLKSFHLVMPRLK